MTLLDRVREFFDGYQDTSREHFDQAVEVSNDLLEKFRSDERSRDPAVALMSSIWAHRHNVPYTVTVYEADQEMRAATKASQQ